MSSPLSVPRVTIRRDAEAQAKGMPLAQLTAVLRSLKRSSFKFSKRLGLMSLLADSTWRRQRLMILCYHGVSLNDEHEWNPGLYVSPAHLEHRLALLRRNRCTVLPLGEAVERLYAGDLPERAVVLTFDDGYYDFQQRAWPLLRSYDMPATVYLTTGRVDYNKPIVQLVAYAMWKTRERVLDGDGIDGLSGRYAIESPAERQRVIADLLRMMPGMDIADKDRISRGVLERLRVDYGTLEASRMLALLQPAEVRALAAAGVDFQLHTHLHRTPADAGEFVRDVLFNQERIRAMTGKTAVHLCYPSGVYRMQYLQPLADAGVRSATTCDPALADPTSAPLLLPRFVDTMGNSDVEFEAWVLGVASCLPRRTTRAPRAAA
jgi:peptidoglycan/xylan/chitin deacetylase (PgdA/CDA1 family)